MEAPLAVIAVLLLTNARLSWSQLQCLDVCSCYEVAGRGVIDCSSRGLTDIPELRNPPGGLSLKVDFSNNLLTALDVERLFRSVAGRTIDVLDFSNNYIDSVIGNFDAHEGRDYLTLNLSYNTFTSFPPSLIPLNHWRSDLVIDISYNGLTELNRHMFAGGDSRLFGFHFLARNNMISEIHDETFLGVTVTNATIDLRSNQLKNLASNLQVPTGIRKFRISGNPLHCDCSLKSFFDNSQSIMESTAKDPSRCSTPSSLRGIPVFSLGEKDLKCSLHQQGFPGESVPAQDRLTLTCTASDDSNIPKADWSLSLPCLNCNDSSRFAAPAVQIATDFVQSYPGVMFQCTLRNEAAILDFEFSIHYEGEPAIETSGNDSPFSAPTWSFPILCFATLLALAACYWLKHMRERLSGDKYKLLSVDPDFEGAYSSRRSNLSPSHRSEYKERETRKEIPLLVSVHRYLWNRGYHPIRASGSSDTL